MRSRPIAAFVLGLLFALRPILDASPAGADDEENTCADCHSVLDPPLNTPVERMENDIHAQKGLKCVDCHGGDPTSMEDKVSMSPDKGFRGKPKHVDIPAFCGRCHADGAYMRRFNPRLPTDQLQQYWTSIHGHRLKEGDPKVATCIACHGAHGILPASHADSPVFAANVPATCGACHSQPEYMAEYGIPTDQEEKYRHSVHGDMLLVQRDTSAPACNDCHGNHGAFPPGVASISGVCGSCHANNATLFLASPHRAAFNARNLPECVTCHTNHAIQRPTDAMLGVGEGSLCIRCHQSGSSGYTAAAQMHDAIDRLKTTLAGAEASLTRAKAMGMEVSDEEYALRENVHPQLIKARTETHMADAKALLKVVDEAVAAAAASQTAAQQTLEEAQSRRRNLLLPLVLIVVLMVLLYLKLRQLERR